MRKHYITFLSPGTLFSESTTKPIGDRVIKDAVEMAEQIVERYDARPYGFRFETRIVKDPVPDGEGGLLQVQPKTIDESGTYFLGGTLETLDDIEARNLDSERILRSNMTGNDYPIVCVVVRGYKSTHPFGEKDFVVDATGNIIERGDDPKHVAYRAVKIDAHRAEMKRLYG